MKEVLRPLSAQEELYWRLTYNDQIHPVLAAEIEGSFPVRGLRKALAMLQKRHSLLSVAIEMPGQGEPWTQPVFVRSHEPIPLREIDAAGHHAIAEQIGLELATPFLAGAGPLIRAVVMRSASTNVLVLSASHSVADGMSMLQILYDLLRATTGTVLEKMPMAATAESLLNLAPARPTEASPEQICESHKAGHAPTVALAALPKADTDRLVATARAHHTTLHSVLVAAFLSAMRQTDPTFETRPVRVISPVSTRALLGAGTAVGLYFTSPMSVFEPATRDIWDAATQVRADVTTAASRDALLQATLGMQSLTGPGLTNAAAAAVLEGAFAADAIVSNLGRLTYESDFGSLRLLRVWGPAVLAGRDEAQTLGAITTSDELLLTLTSRRPIPLLLDTTLKIVRSL